MADLGQVQMIVALSGLTGVRYPVAYADATQLWVAVFEAVLDAPPETFATLLEAISDEPGGPVESRPGRRFARGQPTAG